MRKPTILFVACTPTAMAVRLGLSGNDPRRFAPALNDFEVRVINAADGQPLPNPRKLEDAAVVVGGSPLAAYSGEPWMTDLEDFLIKLHGRLPILGLCFGHHLLTRAFGGEVRKNPAGFEFGPCRVPLTELGQTSPLFRSLGKAVDVLQSHEDVVVRAPFGSKILAYNEAGDVQALHYGQSTLSLQFHPEATPESLRNAALAYRNTLVQQGFRFRGESRRGDQAFEELLRSLQGEAPDGQKILSNFASMAHRFRA